MFQPLQMLSLDRDIIKLKRVSIDSVKDFKPGGKACIICNNVDGSEISTENGQEKIRAAANVRNDIVTERLNSLCEEAVFYYHMSNECYKKYCHKKSL